MFLTKTCQWSLMECIIVCCATSINASEYGDIDLNSHHQDVSTCEKNEDLNNCNNKSTKRNEHMSNVPHFKTVLTSKPDGRLGNHILSYMQLMRIELKYNVTILTEKVVKKSLDTFFKNFNNIPTVDDDACGYNEFFDQFDKAEDNLIIDAYREKSGINVTKERVPEGIRIYPIEIGNKYMEEINAGMDHYKQRFLQSFKADSMLLPSHCKYKWEIFRVPHKVLKNVEWNTNRALILYPGLEPLIWEEEFRIMVRSRIDEYDLENDLLAKDKSFQNAFFERLTIKDKFVNHAQKILHVIKENHKKRHNLTDKCAAKKTSGNCFIFVGIHIRRTDHREYERNNDMKHLDLEYYLRAMRLYRMKFKKEHERKTLMFVLLSDDIQWGKRKLLPQAKDGDLYVGGEGLPNDNESIGNDLALLANCNHTIESHGTFSYLAGAFAGGFKIKPRHFQKYREPKFRNTKFWNENPLNSIPPRLSLF